MSKFGGLLSKKQKHSEVVEEKSEKPKAKTKVAGRSADPAYQQATAYIPRDLHEDVMREIYKRQQFSELIEELLTEWLATRKAKSLNR
jgi:hypothetical protein